MLNKKFIDELRELLRLRGKVSKEQWQYAMVEAKAMMQIHPIINPSEEVRFSNLRTLESYIGEKAIRTANIKRGG
ncbi:MAG: hypothetical protein ABFR82_12710 [Nitrospirota bacterium]